MSPFQVTTVSFCILAGLIAGFSILILPFTAPAISTGWGLSPDQLGTLLSASLFGMMMGALLIAPKADKTGRRTVILFSMTLITFGLFVSAFTRNVQTLMIARLITGLGIGGSLASINTLISEYCSIKRRDLAIGIFVSCGALSGILGGAVTAFFIVRFDWSAAFLFGASVSALTTISLALWLPESVHYLLGRRPDNALKRINELLEKMRIEPMDAMPEVATSSDKTHNFRIIFSAPYLVKTVLMWVSIVMVL